MMEQKIDPNYQQKSPDPARRCGVCVNFQPVPGSELDGRCFGAQVTADGLCDFYTSKRN